MNPLLALLLAAAMVGGPLADLQWAEYLEAIESQLAEVEPPPAPLFGLRAEHRSGMDGKRSTLSGRVSLAGIVTDFRLEVQPEQRPDRDPVFLSAAIGTGSGRLRVDTGPLRGGLGSGLLVWSGRWGSSPYYGAAWSGLPARLRARPASRAAGVPTGIVVTAGRSRQWVFVTARLPQGGRLAAAGWTPASALRFVVAAWTGGRGLEVTTGTNRDALSWRLSASAWWVRSGGRSGAVEMLLSGGQAWGRWWFRLWRAPDAPIAAPPVRGATKRYRSGGHLGVRLRPAGRATLEGAVQVGLGGGGPLVAARWEERLGFSIGLWEGGKALLRARWRSEEERVPWRGTVRSDSRLLDLRLQTGRFGSLHATAGLKVVAHDVYGTSAGGWLQLVLSRSRWRAWSHLTRTLPAPGQPIYWYEPAPAGSWGIRAVRKGEMRMMLGAAARPEGWHMQVVLSRRGFTGVRLGWRFRPSPAVRQSR